MANKHIKLALPVRVDGDNDLADAEGFCVAYEGNVAPYNAVMNEVAKCLNYHHRLREALDRLVRSCDNLEYEAGMVALPASDAEDLLTELDNLEKGL
jgi:hypothetical protein